VAGGGGPGARLGGDGVGGETDSRAAELWDRLRRMSREEREAIFEAENALGGAAWDDLVATFEQAEMVGRFMQASLQGGSTPSLAPEEAQTCQCSSWL
jgi:hypothetical protein